eukprot:59551_1
MDREMNLPDHEEDGPRHGGRRNPRTTCAGISCILLFYCAIAVTGLSFIFVDSTQNGIINYHDTTSFYHEKSNRISCGHQIIELYCAHDTSLCWTSNNVEYIHRKDVAPSYDESDAQIYYICSCIGCIIPYMLLSLLWVCTADVNRTACGIKTKHICSVFCSLSLIASLMAVVFGVSLTNCSNGLSEYILEKIDNSDNITIKEIDMYYGETLVFMMITSGITLFFTGWCIQCSIRGNKMTTSSSSRQWTMIFEGKKDDTLGTHYGSANTELHSLNVMDEGLH